MATATMAATEASQSATLPSRQPFRVRTLTAGVTLDDLHDLRSVEAAIATLKRGRARLEAAGYEVQTVRIATSPFSAAMSDGQRGEALRALQSLDALLQAQDVIASIGPCAVKGLQSAELAAWITELLGTTTRIATSVSVASTSSGIDDDCTRAAAEAIVKISRAAPDGAGNFRFAAAACVPAGTPFFPVAWHEGPRSLAVGLESPGVVESAISNAPSRESATLRLRSALNQALMPVERLAEAFAAEEGCAYLGIDTSPAPALDRSIGAALESFMHKPFGSSGTVDACAVVTAALRSLDVKTCGYAGLMLPVVEDLVLAQRAIEGRFGMHDLLLYSSVCGTGLDLVPLPGDTSVETVERIICDTAALSTRWSKPLAARLLLVPGKKAGELVEFADPLLTGARVMDAG